MSKALSSTSEVIDALGGTTATRLITGRSGSTASNWRARKRFPPDTFLVLKAELQARGYTAPPALWGIVEPQGRAQ